jgi:hypothetical protein
LTFAGSIAGHGGVTVADNNVGGVRFEGANSTFDGGLYVSGKSGGQFQAMCPGSLGSYASVTGDYGHIDADFSVEAGDGKWTWGKFVEFAKNATWLNGAFALLDARLSPAPLAVDANDISEVPVLGVAGKTVLSNADRLMDGFLWHAGVLEFAAGESVDWSGGIGVSSASLCTNPVPGCIVLDNGVSVKTARAPVQIGGMKRNSPEEAARLVVKNATLANEDPHRHEFESATESAFVMSRLQEFLPMRRQS